MAPQAAQAALYAPGATLDPACAPTDSNCGVQSNTAVGTLGQVPYYAAAGNVLAATSTMTILSNGNVGIGTTTPTNALDVVGAGSFSAGIKTAQVTEGIPNSILSNTPVTAGVAPFQIGYSSFTNNGGGAGTYNHGTFYGYNIGRADNQSVTANKPGWMMGMEDNYFDAGGDNTYGTEWYIQYFSPDGTTAQNVRPFYARVKSSDTNDDKNIIITSNMGSGPSGQYSFYQGTNLLFDIRPAGININVDTALAGKTLSLTGSGAIKMSGSGSTSFNVVTNSASPGYHTIANTWGNSSNPGITVGTTRTDGTAFTVANGITKDASGYANSDGTSLLTVLGQGNVGIGTTSPSQLLTVGNNNQFTVSSAGVLLSQSATIGQTAVLPVVVSGNGGGSAGSPNGTYSYIGQYNSHNYYQRGMDNFYIWYQAGTYWTISTVLGNGASGQWYFSSVATTPPPVSGWAVNNGFTGSPTTAIGSTLSVAIDTAGDLSMGGQLQVSGTGNSYILGNLGIGTTTPFAKLSIQANAGETNGTLFAIGSSTSAYATTTLFSIANTGDVTIKGSGGGTCTIGGGSGATMCSSDERLKTNITLIPNALHDIEQIRGVTFNWADPTKNQNQFIGVIAQDVQKVFPQAVATLPNGYLGVDYAALVAPLIEAVKELAGKVSGFAQSITTVVLNATTVHTDNLCIGSTCVTESQLKTLLQNNGQQSNFVTGTTISPITITDVPLSEIIPDTASTTPAVSEEVASTTPAE